MEKMKRTATCGSLRASDDGKTIILNGWVHRNRDHGGIHFINLRDRYGETQIVVDEDVPAPLAELAGSLKFEYCVAIEGLVRKRPDSMINPDMPTGEIEISVKNIEVLNTSLTLPFMVEDETDSNETARLKYRYLDLRSKGMQNRIILRNKVTYALREYLQKDDFLEIETPTLIKSTPEGARDFLVPSRLHAGKFFALPQSPQLYKQLLMVSGFDKYFQVARCYRDEDARGDRQLEFTQIDIEMSFVSKDDIFAVAEGMMGHIFREALNTELPVSFERLPYDDAMNLYGSDKPDLRFGLAFQDFASFVPDSEFSVFKSVLESDGVVKAMVVPGAAAGYSRKKISDLEETAKTFGAKGLAWMKVTAEGLDGGISKFFTAQADDIKKGLGASEGDLILLMAANWKTACNSLGAVRSRLGKDLNLIDESQFKFVWIVDFPLFDTTNKIRPGNRLTICSPCPRISTWIHLKPSRPRKGGPLRPGSQWI